MNNKIMFFYSILVSLLPTGRLWNFGENIRKVLKIVCLEFAKLKEYIDGFVRESIPYTAEDTIKEWLEQYGIEDTGDEISNKNLIAVYANAYGGSSIEYLTNIVKARYPKMEIVFDETTYKTVTITGQLDTKNEELQLIDFLEKTYPAYIVRNLFVIIVEDYGQFAVCGDAICGVSVCGYYITNEGYIDYGRYGVYGIGVCGAARTGNADKELNEKK